VQSGDLSADMAARLIVVFDHTIATLPPASERRRRRLLKARQWKRAAACWQVDTHMLKVIIDWQYRTPYNVDVATFTCEEEAEHIEAMLDRIGLPYGNFIPTTVEELARVHANMPHIAAIFDAAPNHRFSYGAKSRATAVLT
jgi:hypothetical protein